MAQPKKPSRLARLPKQALIVFALIAFALQISSHIFSFRVVVRSPTRILQLGTSGASLCAVYTSYPKPEVLNSAYEVWWDHDFSHSFLSCNFTPPHLTLQYYGRAAESEPSDPIDPNILVSEWKLAGVHRVVYGIIPANFPDDRVPQSLIELDTWWLTPLWLLPLIFAIHRRHRNHTLRAAFCTLSAITFTTAVCASLLLAIAVAIFWCRDFSRLESLAFTHYYSTSPFECRTFVTGSYPGLFQFGIFTQSDVPRTTGLAYRSSNPKPHYRSFIDSEFGATWFLKLHPLELHSPVCAIGYQPNKVALASFRPWLLQLLTLILPITWLLLRLRKKPNLPSDHRLCPNCSYDLHAHNPGDRCPECGTPTSSPFS